MSKIIKVDEIRIFKSKIKNKKIVLAGGCFDVLHKGHEKFLRKAKKCDNILIILLEHDESVKQSKGKDRPVFSQMERAANLSRLNLVDFIILLSYPMSDLDYFNLTKLIEPDIIAVTKGDPFIKIKKEQAEAVGGGVVTVMDRDKRFSSTKIIRKK